MSEWKDKTYEEQLEIYAAVMEVYKKHENPSWLEKPHNACAYVNVLMAPQQVDQDNKPEIRGRAPLDQKDKMEEIKKDLTEACKSTFELRIDCGYPVGVKFGGIQAASKVLEEGDCDITWNEGEVLLIAFWASWNPPCQEPMEKCHKIMEENKEAFAGKVRIVGASCDHELKTVKEHVETKGWTAVEHVYVRKTGCTAAENYGAQGITHYVFVDTTGTIVWMGHPLKRKDLVGDLKTLLSGGKLPNSDVVDEYAGCAMDDA